MPGLLLADQKCPVSNCESFYNSYTLLSHFKHKHAGGIVLESYEAEMNELSVPIELHEPNKVFCVGLLCFKGRQGHLSPVVRGICYPNDLPPNEGHLKTSLPVVAFGCWIGSGMHFVLWLAAPTIDIRIKTFVTFVSDDDIYEYGKIVRTRHLDLESQDPFEFMPHDDNYMHMSERHMLTASMRFTKPVRVVVNLYHEELLLHL